MALDRDRHGTIVTLARAGVVDGEAINEMTNAPCDTIASWYDEHEVHTPFHQEMVIPNLLSLVGGIDGQQVCDVACGQGITLRELARRSAKVTGVDISSTLLDLARGYYDREPLGIRYVVDDAR